MRATMIVACVAGLAMTGTAAAQSAERQGTWETSVGISFTNSTDADFNGGTSADFESDTGFRLAFDYHYTDNLQFGASIGLGQSDYSADIAGDAPGESFRARGDLEYWTLMGNAAYNFMDGPFTPFVTGGLGWSWVDTNIATDPPRSVAGGIRGTARSAPRGRTRARSTDSPTSSASARATTSATRSPCTAATASTGSTSKSRTARPTSTVSS